MSNVDELPDLAGDVRDRAVPPPYEQVTRRVRARRLRAVTGTLAATALAVGGLAVWQNVTAAPSTDPLPPASNGAPSPTTVDATWQDLVASDLAQPFDVSATDDGAIAVVWRDLIQPQPTFALVIRDADGSVQGRLLDEPLSLTPVPGGWVGVLTTHAWFIGSDGSWTELGPPGDPVHRVLAGDVLIAGQYSTWLYRPSGRAWYGTEGWGMYGDYYVADDGSTAACSSNGMGRVLVFPRKNSDPDLPGRACMLAGHGDVVAVAGLGDAPDGNIPLTGVLIRSGTAWTKPRLTGGPRDVASMVVSARGTTFVTGTYGGAVAIAPDGSWSALQVSLGVVVTAGDRLYATSNTQSKGALLYSDDDGATWHETTLPGLE